MNYDKIILEMLERIKKLEEKVDGLNITKAENINETRNMTKSLTQRARDYIIERKNAAINEGDNSITLLCNDIQIALGVSNRTPCICQAMYDCMKPGDIVLSAPPSGKSTTVLVKYFLDDSAIVSNDNGINDKNDQVMTLSQLKTNFKAYFSKKKPNYKYPGPLYGMVFYITKHDLGISLQKIISGEISLEEYESIIRNHFSNLGSTNLSGRTSAYKDAMKNFLEFIEDEHLRNIKVIG